MDEAQAHARAVSRERALKAAIRAGTDNPQVVIEELAEGLDTYRIRARAMGNPRLAANLAPVSDDGTVPFSRR